MPTDAGDLYFKAVSARPPPEPALIRALAERWPANVPSLVAVDEERRYWPGSARSGGGPRRGSEETSPGAPGFGRYVEAAAAL